MNRFILIAALLLSYNSYSQSSHYNTFYARVGLNEPSIGYERKIHNGFGLGIEGGYRFRMLDESYVPYGVVAYPLQSFMMHKAYKGVTLRPIIFNFYNESRRKISISTHYQFLTADNIIYDPGKSGGSNTSDYAKYADSRHQIGISVLYGKSFRKVPALSWFLEIGAKQGFYTRNYSIEGTYSSQVPSTRVQTGKDFSMILNGGLRINVFGF
jgi:hypothetical protein